MPPVFGRPIVTQKQVEVRIKEIGRQITTDYAERDLLMVGILKGACIFYADLVRAVRLPIAVDFLTVSSYGSNAKSSQKVTLLTDLTEDIAGRDVILVEDIVDSGLTIKHLQEIFSARNPKSLAVCALLNKAERRIVEVSIDYVGFDIPNKFVVGYGLDYQQRYRNLPYLAVLEEAGDVDQDLHAR